MQEVRTPDGDIAQIIAFLDDDILVARQDRHQVDLDLLKIVDLTCGQRIQRGQRIGHRGPDNLVHIDDLAARHPGCGFVARHIVVELFIGHRHAGLIGVLIEHKGAGADVFRDRLIGRGFGNTCRHDERRHRGLLGNHVDQRAKGLGQRPDNGFIICRLKAFGHVKDQLPAAVALAPTGQRGNNIGAGHRRAIVEHQPLAQGERIDQPVVRCFPAGHLRLRGEILVHRRQHVIDHIGVVTCDVRRGDHRIQHPQARVHDRRDRGFFLREARGRHQQRSRGHQRRRQPPALFQCGS